MQSISRGMIRGGEVGELVTRGRRPAASGPVVVVNGEEYGKPAYEAVAGEVVRHLQQTRPAAGWSEKAESDK